MLTNAKTVSYEPFDRICRLHYQYYPNDPKDRRYHHYIHCSDRREDGGWQRCWSCIECVIRNSVGLGSTAVNEIRCVDIRIVTAPGQMKIKKLSRFARPSPQFHGDARVSTSLSQALPTLSVSSIRPYEHDACKFGYRRNNPGHIRGIEHV